MASKAPVPPRRLMSRRTTRSLLGRNLQRDLDLLSLRRETAGGVAHLITGKHFDVLLTALYVCRKLERNCKGRFALVVLHLCAECVIELDRIIGLLDGA